MLLTFTALFPIYFSSPFLSARKKNDRVSYEVMTYEVMTYEGILDALEQNLIFLKIVLFLTSHCLNHFPMSYGPLVELYQFYFRYEMEEENAQLQLLDVLTKKTLCNLKSISEYFVIRNNITLHLLQR